MTNEDISSERSAVPSSSRVHGTVAWQRVVVIALSLMIVAGPALRLKGLGASGFAEDEIHKIKPVRPYTHGDFTATADHPLLMNVLLHRSMRASRAWAPA